MVTFVDRVVLHLKAGRGGNGCASVRREKFKALAGADGGSGGHGGSVYLYADPASNTLIDFYRRPHRQAPDGQMGRGRLKNGARGQDLYLPVPLGTSVLDRDGRLRADFATPGQTECLARGGIGGLGSAALACPRRKAPGFALLGTAGDELSLSLELKSVAEAALVGFPSAGKSSLIAAMSAARPKIADYPFTTLRPNLGVVDIEQYRYVVADVPGLIEGASRGLGLGLEFLRHIERCRVVVHVIDCATPESGRDPITDWRLVNGELKAYKTGPEQIPLADRPQMVVLNKVDLTPAKELADLVRSQIEQTGVEVFCVSAATHEGLRSFMLALGRLIQACALPGSASPPSRLPVFRPNLADEFSLERREEDGEIYYQLVGEKPAKWLEQTDFNNEEAIGYLAERLEKLGVEQRLVEMGASPGQAVWIGDYSFDWDPDLPSSSGALSARGTDWRLTYGRRASRKQRRAEYATRVRSEDED